MYGACATMYFMLTGIHPEEAVHRLIRDRVVPLTRFHEIKMDPGQKRAIMKGMAVKAKNRYKSMERLCQDLYKEKAEIIRRHRMQVLGVVVLLALAGSGVFIWRIKRTDHQPDMIKQTNVTQISGQAEDMMATGAAIEPDSTSVPTPTPVSYEMIQVVGMKKTEAVKKLQKLSFVQIKIKKVASKKNQQGKVIKQSIPKGKKLKQDKTYVLVLNVGKGPEKATPTPVVTATPTPKVSQKSKKKKQQYDGALPW